VAALFGTKFTSNVKTPVPMPHALFVVMCWFVPFKRSDVTPPVSAFALLSAALFVPVSVAGVAELSVNVVAPFVPCHRSSSTLLT
jgi:hypothetical protein